MDKFCEERSSWPRPRIKLIIDVEKDYYEMIKYNVEHGQDYKPFEIIANGVPYNPTGDSISREGLKEVINDLFRSGEYDCNSVLKAIDNAPIVTPSHNLNNITEEDIEKFMVIFQRAHSKGLLTIAERPQGEWIPVRERLPEDRINPNTNDFEDVLCSTIWDDVRLYKYGKPIGYHKAHFWHGRGIMDEVVIAWQYKPEPYKKGGAT